jgi:hypothetical protein
MGKLYREKSYKIKLRKGEKRVDKEIKQCFLLLKDYRGRLTKQQFRTFKGQILNGNIEEFRKELFRLMKVKYTKQQG